MRTKTINAIYDSISKLYYIFVCAFEAMHSHGESKVSPGVKLQKLLMHS